jgi:hypothetical protein
VLGSSVEETFRLIHGLPSLRVDMVQSSWMVRVSLESRIVLDEGADAEPRIERRFRAERVGTPPASHAGNASAERDWVTGRGGGGERAISRSPRAQDDALSREARRESAASRARGGARRPRTTQDRIREAEEENRALRDQVRRLTEGMTAAMESAAEVSAERSALRAAHAAALLEARAAHEAERGRALEEERARWTAELLGQRLAHRRSLEEQRGRMEEERARAVQEVSLQYQNFHRLERQRRSEASASEASAVEEGAGGARREDRPGDAGAPAQD